MKNEIKFAESYENAQKKAARRAALLHDGETRQKAWLYSTVNLTVRGEV